jgi:hypothetical protein
LAVPIAVEPDAPLDVVEVVEVAVVDDVGAGAAAAVLEVELLELPHPATAIAEIASAKRPAPRNFAVLKVAIHCSRLVSSHP